jgi:hypothetical protein
MIIDRQVPLLLPQLMPTSTSHALLFSDGSLRHSRARTFAPATLNEISRITSELLYRHETYVRDCQAVLNGKPARGFRRLPSEWLFDDPVGIARLAPDMPSIEVSVSLRKELTQEKPWNGRVKSDYARDRFMASLSRDAIAKRASDIFLNLSTSRDDDAAMPAATRDMLQGYWFSRFAEIYVELELRGDASRQTLNELVGKEEWTGSFKTANQLFNGPLRFPADLQRPYLVKYEQKQYVGPMLEQGRIRISPASIYNDSSLNVATRDNELQAELFVSPLERAGFGGVPGPLAAMIHERRPLIKALGTNFYVFCCSTRAMTRLAHDFRRDACMVIRDVDAFRTRLDAAVRKTLGDWRFITAKVEYYDPLAVNEIEVDVLTWKHFRHAYQEETRFAWLPPAPLHDLKPIDVELGSLTDICELVDPSAGEAL